MFLPCRLPTLSTSEQLDRKSDVKHRSNAVKSPSGAADWPGGAAGWTGGLRRAVTAVVRRPAVSGPVDGACRGGKVVGGVGVNGRTRSVRKNDQTTNGVDNE